MAESLCPGKKVSWAVTKIGISMNDLTVEAQIYMDIICSRISTCTRLTTAIDLHAYMVAYKLDNNFLNVGCLVTSDMKFYRIHSSMHLLFLSLMTKLCKRAGVVMYPGDTWVCPGTPIYPLKI